MEPCLTELVSQMMCNYVVTMNQMDQTYTQRINDLMIQKQNCQNKINQLFLNRFQTIVNTLQNLESLQTESTSNTHTNHESNHGSNHNQSTHHQNSIHAQQNGIDYIHLLLQAAEQIDIKHTDNDNNNNNNNNNDINHNNHNTSKQEETMDIDEETASNHNTITFKCNDCNKQFYKTVLLKRHIEMAHNMDNIDENTSNHIESRMNIKSKIKNIRNKKRRNNHLCCFCGNEYQTRAGLRGHITKIHKKKTMKKMVIKPRSFMRERVNDNEYGLDDDRWSESEESRSRSRGRNKGYKRKRNKEENQNDDESDSETDDMEEMIKIIDKMSNDKLKCPKCGKRFDRKHGLKSHLIVHSTKRPYICSWCHQRYKRECSLKLHQKKHCKKRNKHKGEEESIDDSDCNQTE